ncbi:MAG TPA: FAD-dependent oxidoreductase [Roseomonas sp.]|nr:FAD-dependent oxidoreductase [Roseomonas sp.]
MIRCRTHWPASGTAQNFSEQAGHGSNRLRRRRCCSPEAARTEKQGERGGWGVRVALHLRRRGFRVLLVDRRPPGEGASFGNGGLIQREAVAPHPFPRALSELRRIAGNRQVDVSCHPLALPGYAAPLLRYWWHSEPARYRRTVVAHERLIATCLDEHCALAPERSRHRLRARARGTPACAPRADRKAPPAARRARPPGRHP